MNDLCQQVRAILTREFCPDVLNIRDDSALHAGHQSANGKAHLALEIQAQKFNSVPIIQAHRLIYQALSDLMRDKIHALQIHIIQK